MQYINNNETVNYWINVFKIATEKYPELLKLLSEEKKEEIVYYNENKYWTALKNRDYNILHDNQYLIKNAFQFYDNEEKSLQILFDYIKNDSNLCIAGGYPTLQYLEKNLNDYLLSDIDIFILNKYGDEKYEDEDNNDKIYYNNLDIVKKLIDFLDDNFQIREIKSYTDMQAGVFNITCKKIDRVIQIIGTCAKSIAEIFSDFDATYCKCGVYMGETFITYDAKYAKEHQTTLFLSKYPKNKRLDKVYNLGLKIYGMSDYKPQENINKNENLFKFLRTKEGMLKNFIFTKKWQHGYNGEISLVNNIKNQKELGLIRYDELLSKSKSKFISLSNIQELFPNENDFMKLKNIINNKTNNKGQIFMVFPRTYPTFMTGIIEMKKGGLNKIGLYREHDYQCTKFFIPLGEEFGDTKTLDILSNIDEQNKISIKKFMLEQFPNNQMFYHNLARESYIPEDSQEKCKKYKRMSVAIKNDYDPNTKKLKLNIDLIKKNGDKINITEMDVLRKEFKYGCKAMFEIYLDKFWISKVANCVYKQKERNCGCTLVCKTIIIVE
jgi:hypothetical protein